MKRTYCLNMNFSEALIESIGRFNRIEVKQCRKNGTIYVTKSKDSCTISIKTSTTNDIFVSRKLTLQKPIEPPSFTFSVPEFRTTIRVTLPNNESFSTASIESSFQTAIFSSAGKENSDPQQLPHVPNSLIRSTHSNGKSLIVSAQINISKLQCLNQSKVSRTGVLDVTNTHQRLPTIDSANKDFESPSKLSLPRPALRPQHTPTHIKSGHSPQFKKTNTNTTPTNKIALSPLIRSSSSRKVAQHELTSEQQEIINTCCSEGSNVFFSGCAGTGKSFLLTTIIKELEKKHGKCSVCVTATTGLAACAINGVTVHQFAGMAISRENNDAEQDIKSIISLAMSNHNAVKRWRQARVLVVDEISMLSATTLEVLNKIAKRARGSIEPMGGLQVVLSGDFFQLPPVIKNYAGINQPLFNAGVGEDSLNNSQISDASSSHASMATIQKQRCTTLKRFCFQSPVWNQVIQKSFILGHVFRQCDSKFIYALSSIRKGHFPRAVSDLFTPCVNRHLYCDDGILPTHIFTHRKDVDSLNQRELTALPGEFVQFNATDSGEPLYVNMLNNHCYAKKSLRLKVGAQVILVRTIDASEGLVNGAKGVVIKFAKGTSRPVIRFVDGKERSVNNEVFSMVMSGRVLAQRVQLPLDLGWGISVHKSQGMSIAKAVINLRNVFEYGQAYVALSRMRGLEGLSLTSTIKPEQVRAHPAVIEFYDCLYIQRER